MIVIRDFQVVYVGEGGAYVPVPSLKNRPINPNLQTLQTLQSLQGLSGGAGTSGGGTGLATDEDWRRLPESWDREHRRYRPNTTRVQRKYYYMCLPMIYYSFINQ